MRALLVVSIAVTFCACASNDSLSNLTPQSDTSEIDRLSEYKLEIGWEDLGDAYLQELIQKGLQNNLNLENVELGIESTLISLRDLNRQRFPQLNISGTSSYSRTRDTDFVDAYGLNASLSYEIDLWSRIANNYKSGQLGLEDSQSSLRQLQISVTSSICNTYFSLHTQAELIKLQEQQVAILQKQKDLSEVKYSVGEITKSSIDQIEVSIQSQLAAIESAKTQQRVLARQLAILVNASPEEIRLPSHPYDYSDIPRIGMDKPPAALITQRPDVEISERAIIRAGYSLQNARRAWLPSLSLSSSSSAGSRTLGDLLRDENIIASLAANLAMSIYDNGARGRNIERNEIALEQSKIGYEQTLIAAINDIEDAFTRQEENIRQIEIQEISQAAQERLTAVTQVLYETGDATAFDLVREQQNVLNARSQRIRNWQSGMSASISLLQALGVSPDIAEQ